MEKFIPDCQQFVVTRLCSLREEIEQDGEKIASLEVSFALALSDVCDALGLTGEEYKLVLGPEAAAFVEALLNSRVWLTIPLPAAAPVQTTGIAVPAPITEAANWAVV